MARRKSFDISFSNIDEDKRLIETESVRQETGDEDYSESIEKIKKSFKNIGGKLVK